MSEGSCCTPGRPAGEGGGPPPARAGGRVGRRRRTALVRLEGGTFLMGTDDGDGFPADGEGPVRRVRLDPFEIDPVCVSNARFARFVAETGHVTDAERFGWSFVVAILLPDDFPDTRAVAAGALVAPGDGGLVAAPRGPAVGPGRAAPTTPSCTSPGTTPRPTARGPACGCRPRPSGSTPRAGASSSRRLPWGDELTPGRRLAQQHLAGHLPRAQHRRGRLRRAPRRWTRSRPTASASTTSRATSGSGAPTGSTRPSTAPGRPRTRWARPPGRPGSSAGARTCVTTRTATGTAWPRAARTPPTARPATWASAAPATRGA